MALKPSCDGDLISWVVIEFGTHDDAKLSSSTEAFPKAYVNFCLSHLGQLLFRTLISNSLSVMLWIEKFTTSKEGKLSWMHPARHPVGGNPSLPSKMKISFKIK